VNCSDGPCRIDCATDACSGADIYCGSGACQAVCSGTPTPGVHGCLGACNCSGC
jgi:hypothetical protein